MGRAQSEQSIGIKWYFYEIYAEKR